MSRSPRPLRSLALLAALACACSGSAPVVEAITWTPREESALSDAQRAQYTRALKAKDLLFTQLLGELTAALEEGGPAGAIEVCRDVAPQLARDVSAKTGIAVGRTSWKLRNPANVAPAWARTLLESRPETPRLAAGSDGALGVTLPIRLGAACVQCHGPREALADDVRERLAALYVEDQATGFAEGDLRGWFWLEVPGAAR